MSKFELDEHDVQVILQLLRERGSGMAREIADRLDAQVPLDVPTKIGAVVRTSEGVFVLADGVDARHWYLSGGVEDWRTPGDLGHILAVLSEGVDE